MRIQFFPSKSPVFVTHKLGEEMVPGHFVRFTPSADMTDAEIEETKIRLEALGATVKILPKERKRRAVAKEKVTKTVNLGPRKVVKSLVQASTSQYKAELDEATTIRLDEFKL